MTPSGSPWWETFILTIIAATIAGLLVPGIQKTALVLFKRLRVWRYRIWRWSFWPTYRRLGLIVNSSEMVDADGIWGSAAQFNGVNNGESLRAVRADVHRAATPLEHNGQQFGWRLSVTFGGDEALCLFRKADSKYVRKMKGSERVIISCRFGPIPGWGPKHELRECTIVGAWRNLGGGLWRRVAGWKRGVHKTN